MKQPEHLERCLASLNAQEGCTSDTEIIVVDNGSDELPEGICAKRPGTTLLREVTPGPGPARNKGISQARGDLLAFIDADCRAHPKWLHAIEQAFSDPATLVIGGDVQVPFADESNPTSLECYERVYAYRNKKYIASGYSGTGNLAMRPDAYAQVGPFAGIELAEDRDWGGRATALGIVTKYVPDMIVYHPARTEFSEMKHKWDRHILHDLSEVKGMRARAKWALRAILLALSPVGELPKILLSPRIDGIRQRFLAFICLSRVRLYRAGRMLKALVVGKRGSAIKVWNRG